VRARTCLLLALAVPAWLGLGTAADAQAAPARPNILVIVTDDQPLGTLGAMPETRRLFAQGGRSYPNAYVTTPLCCPSRASILTGRYAHNHGVLTQEPQSFDVRTTIPRYLQRAGYLTGIVGKYLNRWGSPPTFPPVSPPYFDLWATTRPSSSGYYGTVFNVNGQLRKIKRYSTHFMGTQTTAFLRSFERHDRRPWFMYTGVVAPHLPAVAEPAYRKKPVSPWAGDPGVFEADRTDKPPYVQAQNATFARGQNVRTSQLRALRSVDDLVERTFAELRRLGEARNTLAIFVSDNGLLWAQHGIVNKTVPYLEGIRVPLLLRWPARASVAGSVDERLVANVDIAPSIAQVAGLHVTGPPMDGRSLFDRRWSRDHVLVEYFEGDTGIAPTWASLTALDSQYVEYYDEDGRITFREQYDLVQDPFQLTNTLGDLDPSNNPGPVTLAGLSGRLAADRACVGSACP
jgi:arylsulfatase A-like enzyme